MKIQISSVISAKRFQELCDLWDQNEFATLEMKVQSSGDLDDILLFALRTPSRELVNVLIEAIAEHPLTTAESLKSILMQSDVAARETVCMRDDLSAELKSECARLHLVHKKHV